MKKLFATTAVALLLSAPAFASPMTAIAAADALAAAQADADAKAAAIGAAKNGDVTGGDTTSKTKTGDTVAAALGQAPSALSPSGICGKDNRFAFGALQWSDYSSKCFNYQIAIIAAQAGNWTLANQWVERADGM